MCVAQLRRQSKSMTGVDPDVLYMMISLYRKIVNTSGKGMLECRDNYWTFCNGTHEVYFFFFFMAWYSPNIPSLIKLNNVLSLGRLRNIQ